jgi:hypothetical protein
VRREIDLHIRGGIVLPMVDDEEFFRGDLLVDGGRIVESSAARQLE